MRVANVKLKAKSVQLTSVLSVLMMFARVKKSR